MAGNAIRIAVLANASQAKAELDSIQSRSQKFSAGLRKAGALAAVGFAAVGVAAVKAGQAAAQDEAAQSKLAQTLRTGAKATDAQVAQTERFITATGKALGVADDELRPALGRLALASGSVAKAQAQAKIAMDVSAGSGKSLEAVSTALAKAQATGNVKALAKFGVATKDAQGKTLSLAQVTQQLADKYKGAASTAADTTAGKQKKLTVQMGELQEQIGAKLLPVMQKLADAGLKAIDWMSKNEGKAKALAIVVGSIGVALIAANVGMTLFTAGMAIYSAVATTITAVTKAWQLAQIALNIAMMINPVGVIVLGIVALIAIIVLVIAKSDKMRALVMGAFDKLKSGVSKAVGAVVGFVKKNWPLLLAIITGPIGLAVLAVVRNWDTIKAKTSAVWNGIKTLIGNAISGFMTKVNGIKDKVTGAFSGAAGWLKDAGRKIIQGLINGIGEMFGKVKDKLGELTGKLTSWKGPPKKDAKLLFSAGRLIIGGLNDGFDAEIPEVKKTLGGLTKFIGGTSLTSGLDLGGSLSLSSSNEQTLTIRLSADQVSQLQRGRELQADLDAFASAGGRRRAA